MTTSSARKMTFRLVPAMAAERALFPSGVWKTFSASLLSKETAATPSRFVIVQREIDFICNDTGPLHHTRNVNLNPPCLELLERHSIGTLQDAENFISHGARSTGGTSRRAFPCSTNGVVACTSYHTQKGRLATRHPGRVIRDWFSQRQVRAWSAMPPKADVNSDHWRQGHESWQVGGGARDVIPVPDQDESVSFWARLKRDRLCSERPWLSEEVFAAMSCRLHPPTCHSDLSVGLPVAAH